MAVKKMLHKFPGATKENWKRHEAQCKTTGVSTERINGLGLRRRVVTPMIPTISRQQVGQD